MNSNVFLKNERDLLKKGGLYVISQPDFVTPKDRYTKVGMAHTFQHRFGNSGYSTNYPDGFNVNYIMTAPRHKIDDRTLKTRLHLRENDLLRTIHKQRGVVKPNPNSKEWFTTTNSRRDPKEIALASLQEVWGKRKEASTIYECRKNQCDPVPGFERRYGKVVDDVVVRTPSTRLTRKRAHRKHNR
jgi:hypothetical protein